jgi:hypothetical protein
MDAERALEKITAVLPEATRREVERLTGVIGFLSRRQPFNLDDPRLIALQAAIGGAARGASALPRLQHR